VDAQDSLYISVALPVGQPLAQKQDPETRVLLPEADSGRPIPEVADPIARPALAGTSAD
jgi:hypothetical protein